VIADLPCAHDPMEEAPHLLHAELGAVFKG
jgi:hypothetical protein